jgi:hypothetical protein
MMASMFNLDHRLAELRPSEAELRLARQRREAAERSAPALAGSATRSATVRVGSQPARAVAG